MSNYWYTLTKTNYSRRFVITNVQSENIPALIYQELLNIKRNFRYNKLFQNFDFDYINDEEAIRNYLPDQYKQYANDLDKLKEQLASLYEICKCYTISNIEIAPNCLGCIYECPGQRDHMQCPTGCLHDPSTCYECHSKLKL